MIQFVPYCKLSVVWKIVKVIERVTALIVTSELYFSKEKILQFLSNVHEFIWDYFIHNEKKFASPTLADFSTSISAI